MALDSKNVLTGQLRNELFLRNWDVYAVGATGVIRSPDRKVFIISTHCTAQDIIQTVNMWRPPVRPVSADN